MPESIQPDLFGEYDRAQEEAARWRQPASCPACGTKEPSGYMLRQNHGADPAEAGICGFPPGEHPIYEAMCTAQYLVSNHITYAARHDEADMLAERMERGRVLGLDVEAIAVAARENSPKKNA